MIKISEKMNIVSGMGTWCLCIGLCIFQGIFDTGKVLAMSVKRLITAQGVYVLTLQAFKVLSRLGRSNAAISNNFLIRSTDSKTGISKSLVLTAANKVSRGTMTASFFFLPRPEIVEKIIYMGRLKYLIAVNPNQSYISRSW